MFKKLKFKNNRFIYYVGRFEPSFDTFFIKQTFNSKSLAFAFCNYLNENSIYHFIVLEVLI